MTYEKTSAFFLLLTGVKDTERYNSEWVWRLSFSYFICSSKTQDRDWIGRVKKKKIF